MKEKSLSVLLGVLMCASVTGTAKAASPSAKMTCKDFIALDEVSRPKMVYWIDGFDRHGNAEEAVDFDRDDRLVPIVVEDCTKNPKHLLGKKVQAARKKIASN